MKIKLSKWAKNNSLGYRTAWNLFKAGKLPVKAYVLATGTILVDEEEKAATTTEELLANFDEAVRPICLVLYGLTAGEIKFQQCREVLINE